MKCNFDFDNFNLQGVYQVVTSPQVKEHLYSKVGVTISIFIHFEIVLYSIIAPRSIAQLSLSYTILIIQGHFSSHPGLELKTDS